MIQDGKHHGECGGRCFVFVKQVRDLSLRPFYPLLMVSPLVFFCHSGPGAPAQDFEGILAALKKENAVDDATLGLAFDLTEEQQQKVVRAFGLTKTQGAAALVKKFTGTFIFCVGQCISRVLR